MCPQNREKITNPLICGHFTTASLFYGKLNMFVLTAVILLLSPPPLYNYSVLLTAPFGGSHLALMSHLARILSDHGHVAVIATPEHDAVISTNHTLLTPHTPGLGFTKTERSRMSAECMKEIMGTDTSLSTVAHIGADCRREAWGAILRLSSYYFLGQKFVEQIRQLKIDLIIADDANIRDMSILAAELNIPLICFSPWSNHFRAREAGGYSQLLTKEPSHMWPHLLHQGFTVTGCLQAYINYFKFRKYAEDREGDAGAAVDVYLVNDVTYFSYPYMSPPNLYLVGGIYLSPHPAPLDTEYSHFTSSSQVVYVSFGSYAIPDWLPWFPTLFEALESSKATSVIAKINQGPGYLVSGTSRKFIFKNWVPQQALLGSGRVKLFISHCGQNSRIEAAYYGVPMLCIPLFGDQVLNSYLMQWNKFGIIQKKEEVEMRKLRDLIDNMLENSTVFRSNIDRARSMFIEDPISKPDKFLFLVNTLGKNGKGALKVIRNPQDSAVIINIVGILFLSSISFLFFYISLEIGSLPDENERFLDMW